MTSFVVTDRRSKPSLADSTSGAYTDICQHGDTIGVKANARKGLDFGCGFGYAETIPMAVAKVLIVEDDDSLRRVTQLHLEKLGFMTSVSPDAETALQILEKSTFDVLLTDLNLPGMSGINLLKQVKMDCPETIVILITAFATVATAVEAMKSGAYDYVTKPLQHFAVKDLMLRAIDHRRLAQEVRLLEPAWMRESALRT